MTSSHHIHKHNQPSTVTLAKAQISHHLSRRPPYYLTSDEAHRVIAAAENDRDHLFLRVLWETGIRVSEAICVKLGDVGRDGIRVLGKGSVERVVFVQESPVTEILFYAQERALGRDEHLISSRKGGHITKQRETRSSRRPRGMPISSVTSMRTRSDMATPSTSSTAAAAWMPYRNNWGTETSTPLASTFGCLKRTSRGKSKSCSFSYFRDVTSFVQTTWSIREDVRYFQD